MAIGGNALLRPDDSSIAAQRERAVEVCGRVAALAADGWRVVVTHGNGPQVGAALLRSERAAPETLPLPLDMCVASTQGEMGYLLSVGLESGLAQRGCSHPVTTVLTRVLVSAEDPAFDDPSKPIGPFYTSEQTEAKRSTGWRFLEQPPRGFRRLVASPEPLKILEERVIRLLLGHRALVVTLGGGGIPMIRKGEDLLGVEAVVDKDLSSALLAIDLRADLFLILTDVDGIYLDYATERATRLRRVTSAELRAHARLGHFAPGSMGPKVDAVIRFLAAGGQRAIVTTPEHLEAALAGREGTHAMDNEPSAWESERESGVLTPALPEG